MTKEKLIEKKIFDSKIKTANVKFPELILGYLIGPVGGLLTSQIFVVYLNKYWTDVLGLAGAAAKTFLTLFPLISIAFIIIGNLVAGIIIDKTITKQGKARPFLLVAAPLMACATVLLFTVPTGNEIVQFVWIAIAYNLFYSVAFPLYNTANQMFVPLSTRNGKQRGLVSVVNGISLVAASSFASIILPIVMPFVGVDKNIWLVAMCVFAAISLAAVLLQFYFTRERVTEENIKLNIKREKISSAKQFKAVASEKYWWLMIGFFLFFMLSGNMQNFSMVYFCDYILGTYNDGFTQSVLGIVTGIPLGLGMLFAWPLAKKIGKKNSILIGLVISSLGCFIAMLSPKSWVFACIGLFIKCLGAAPASYVAMALFSDVLEHIEAKHGFRCDGFSMSLRSIFLATALSICQGVFNGLTAASGYVAPSKSTVGIANEVMKTLKDGTVVFVQNQATENVIVWCYIGVMMVGYLICAVLVSGVTVEKSIEEDHVKIRERQKAEVIAAGGEWISPEERMRLEQEQADRDAEAARIAELKALCAKKGWNFEEKEAEYQQKRAAKAKKKV